MYECVCGEGGGGTRDLVPPELEQIRTMSLLPYGQASVGKQAWPFNGRLTIPHLFKLILYNKYAPTNFYTLYKIPPPTFLRCMYLIQHNQSKPQTSVSQE